VLLAAARAYDLTYVIVDRNVPHDLIDLFRSGPSGNHLKLIEKFGAASDPVFLYRIEP
jgi:hypothetical protein